MKTVVHALLLLAIVPSCDPDKKPEKKKAELPPVEVADDKLHPSPGETMAINDCNASHISEVVKAYSTADKFAAAVRAGTAYQKKCKHSEGLDWDLLYAHEHLDQWKEALAITDRLVKGKPDDSDYWWWRGKDRGELGKHEGAIVDLRQSLSSATETSNGVQIDPLDKSATATKQRCETAFGLRWLTNVGVELADSAQRQFNQAYLAGACEKLDGKGKLAFTTGMKRTKAKGKLAGKPVNVLIDLGLGTTLVKKEVAEAAQLARGEDVDVMTPTGLGTGALSSADVSVGTASAVAVPVAIVDTLPADIDLVIGLSFLWRFDVKRDGDSATASTPKQ